MPKAEVKAVFFVVLQLLMQVIETDTGKNKSYTKPTSDNEHGSFYIAVPRDLATH